MGLHLFSRYRHLLSIAAFVILAGGVLLLAACGDTTSTNPSTPTATTSNASTPTATTSTGGGNQVSIVENNGVYSFSPATLTITKGTTVTWTNKSDAPHTVTSDNSAFTGSGNLSESQTFQMTFTTAGTYTYHCSIHSYMKATITVTG